MRALQQKLNIGQHFSAADVGGIGIRLVKGLAALHRLNILHRDVKPANLHQGNDGKLRILDLGVALSPGTSAAQLHGNPGTPSFMAPELFTCELASRQSDLYAAGVTLYHLLTRRYPMAEWSHSSGHALATDSAHALPARHATMAGKYNFESGRS